MVQVVLTTEDHQEMETLTVCVRVCVCPSPAGEKQAAHQTVSDPAPLPPTRSEEHTSELQSQR